MSELTGKIQDGLGRKASDVVQNLAQVICLLLESEKWSYLNHFQFIFAFIVAFYLNASLTAVLIATIPMIGNKLNTPRINDINLR